MPMSQPAAAQADRDPILENGAWAADADFTLNTIDLSQQGV